MLAVARKEAVVVRRSPTATRMLARRVARKVRTRAAASKATHAMTWDVFG